MPEAKINEGCIIGLPTCGYAFSSTRMAFIAAPADEEFTLELDALTRLLEDKGYEAYVALQQIDPGKFAFCTKICSKIITSQFCIVLLNSSEHRDHSGVQIPNPNVHMEYGLMLAFKKYILPFQKKGDSLAFNIRPLDTLIYTKGNFKTMADEAIDKAILEVGTSSRPTRTIASNENLLRYIAVRGLRLTDIRTEDANALYALGSPLGFILLDGLKAVYFGLFDTEPAKEVAFRLKLLLQNLHLAHERFVTTFIQTLSPSEAEKAKRLWDNIEVEVLVSNEVDKQKVKAKVRSLTEHFFPIPWEVLNEADIQSKIDTEYDSIGEL